MSIPMNRSKRDAGKNFLKNLAGVLFWLIIWQAAAMIINKKVILVTPAAAAKRLLELMRTASFYRTCANSFLRIGLGFLSGLAAGILTGALSFRFKAARAVISPFMTAARSIPVASFIIFALFWMKSRDLSIFISFLIVMPVIYGAVTEGAANADTKLKEMADVFGLSPYKKIRYLYMPSVMPFLTSACSAASGLAFKSGAAAEVIGQPDNTLGDMLFRSKIYLETADLFAWTAVIILLSKLFETLITKIVRGKR